MRVWAKGSFESSGLGFCFKHASAKARDGVWERNFEFLYSLLVISKLKVLDAFELMGFGWEAVFGWGLKFALCDVEPVTRSSFLRRLVRLCTLANLCCTSGYSFTPCAALSLQSCIVIEGNCSSRSERAHPQTSRPGTYLRRFGVRFYAYRRPTPWHRRGSASPSSPDMKWGKPPLRCWQCDKS